jgi:hypothetical protein
MFDIQSASYASTSSVLNPASSYGGTVAEAGEHSHTTESPGSTVSSTVPTVYQTGMTSTSLSPSMTVGSAGAGVGGLGQELRSSSLSHYVTPGASHLGQWQTPQYHSQYASGVAVPSEGRPSWDMTGFLEPSTATGNAPSAGSGQPLAYYRTTTERASGQGADLGTEQHQHQQQQEHQHQQPDSYSSQSQQQHDQTPRP